MNLEEWKAILEKDLVYSQSDRIIKYIVNYDVPESIIVRLKDLFDKYKVELFRFQKIEEDIIRHFCPILYGESAYSVLSLNDRINLSDDFILEFQDYLLTKENFYELRMPRDHHLMIDLDKVKYDKQIINKINFKQNLK